MLIRNYLKKKSALIKNRVLPTYYNPILLGMAYQPLLKNRNNKIFMTVKHKHISLIDGGVISVICSIVFEKKKKKILKVDWQCLINKVK
jgi:predicted Na+-dependent transporter